MIPAGTITFRPGRPSEFGHIASPITRILNHPDQQGALLIWCINLGFDYSIFWRMAYFPTPRCTAMAFAIAALVLANPAKAHNDSSALCDAGAAAIPEKNPNAPGASAFLGAVAEMDEPQRDRAIRSELLAGNLPNFLRKLQPISLNTRLPGGNAVRMTLCVMADYLSIGSDTDFILVPMGLATALSVALQLGFSLPTRRIVDLIYRQAPVRLKPQPLPPGDQMRSTDYYRKHNAMVLQQRDLMDAPRDQITAGHKKDLVLSRRLWTIPGRVAIYGWHRHNNAPIQPLSTVHGARYADYSHGVRLISNVVFINGLPRSLSDVLADPVLSPLLSDEGTIRRWAELLDGLT
jgi:hypothetical protein